MLEPVRFACADTLITPVALALNEAPPATIAEQGFQLVASGVAVFTFHAEPSPDWWLKNSIHIMPPIDAALGDAVGRYAIPAPSGQAGNQYTRHFQVDQLALHAGLASIEGKPDDLVHEVGFACDSWQPHPFDTLTDAFTQQPLPRLFTGLDADLAVWHGANAIHRVNYHVTLVGKIRFASVIIS